MKTIKIAVLTKNKRYGKALARGLAEETTGIEVICIESEKEGFYDILITDRKDLSGPQILVLSDENASNDNSINRRTATKEIQEKIFEKYLKITGYNFIPQKSKKLYVIGIGSDMGGAGVTSISIVAGRILTMKEEQPVLYINCSGNDDYVAYTNCDTENLKSFQELIYRIKIGQTIRLTDYMSEDYFGLYTMKPDNSFCREYLEILLNHLNENSGVVYIVIDLGRRKDCCYLCHKIININNCKDSRCQNNGTTYNFAYEGGKGNIREDNSSFIQINNKVEISMEGTFANDIGSIIKEELDV